MKIRINKRLILPLAICLVLILQIAFTPAKAFPVAPNPALTIIPISDETEDTFYAYSFDGRIFAGPIGFGRLYVYDGSSWSLSLDLDFPIRKLYVIDGKLYAATGFHTHDSPANVYVYDGASWNLAFSVPKHDVWSLVPFNGKIYIGTGKDTADIYTWDGSSVEYAFTLPTGYAAETMMVYDNKLYIGTVDSSGGNNGDVYVFDGSHVTLSFDSPNQVIYDMATFQGKLYVASSTGTAPPSDVDGGVVYVFDGTQWNLSLESGSKLCNFLAMLDNVLYTLCSTGSDGEVFSFEEGTWNSFKKLNPVADGLAGLDGKLYVGRTSGQVFVLDTVLSVPLSFTIPEWNPSDWVKTDGRHDDGKRGTYLGENVIPVGTDVIIPVMTNGKKSGQFVSEDFNKFGTYSATMSVSKTSYLRYTFFLYDSETQNEIDIIEIDIAPPILSILNPFSVCEFSTIHHLDLDDPDHEKVVEIWQSDIRYKDLTSGEHTFNLEWHQDGMSFSIDDEDPITVDSEHFNQIDDFGKMQIYLASYSYSASPCNTLLIPWTRPDGATVDDSMMTIDQVTFTPADTDSDRLTDDQEIELETDPNAFTPLNLGINLFVDGIPVDPSSEFDLGKKVAVAILPPDESIDRIDVTVTDPIGNTIFHETLHPHSPVVFSFAPDSPGQWTILADLLNGTVLSETLDISFLVIPESAIGSIALVGSSMVALAGYLYSRWHAKRRPMD